MKENKTEEKINTYTNVVLEGASEEVVQRYGSAIKEHLVAYSGRDNETGEELKKGLKDIFNEKISSDYKESNIKQQAGFAAENKYTARQNAEKIIKKDTSRVRNTDIKGSGSYNELFDHIIVDKDGSVISQEQMKFVGSSPKDCLGKLASKKFQKYFDADAIVTVPSDYYQGIIDEADKHIEKLNNQLVHAKDNGNKELAESIQQKINKYTKIKNSVKDSGVSNVEARYARLHPKLSTAKDVTKIAHEAGLEQATYGTIIGGGISLIRNTVAVIKGEKNPKEAGLDFAKDTGASAGISYAIAFSGAVIKGGMQNSASKTIQSLSKTNLAATIVTSAVETGKTLKKFFSGNITGLECLEELGEKGTGQLSAAMFAVAGRTLIPIPVVGAIIGSMVGYVLSSACYGVLIGALKGEKLAKEERIRVEKECEESIKMIIQFREEMNMSVEKYLFDMKDTFNKAFVLAEKSIWNDDIDGFISAANSMSIKLDYKPQFTSFKEFEALMESDSVLKL